MGRPFPLLHKTPRPSVGTLSCLLWIHQAWSRWDLGFDHRGKTCQPGAFLSVCLCRSVGLERFQGLMEMWLRELEILRVSGQHCEIILAHMDFGMGTAGTTTVLTLPGAGASPKVLGVQEHPQSHLSAWNPPWW